MSDVISYKCPNCGAPLTFNIPSQKWECHFCASTFDKSESNQFEQQGGGGSNFWNPEAFADEDAAVYECPSCGGQVITDKNTSSTFCAYCHNPTVLASRLKGEYRPARLIPFQFTREQAVEAVKKLCKGRPLLPKEFRKCAENGEITGLYVPFWLFSADVDATMTATGRRIHTWSDGNYRYTKTDVYHVQREGTVPFRLVPVDGSSRMDDRLMDGLEPFSYDQLMQFSMEYLSGFYAENFDVDSQSSFRRFSSRATGGAEQALRDTVRGYTSVDSVKTATKFNGNDCLYVMLPVWTLMISYKGKTYLYAMNGQTGKAVGKLPVSLGRVAAWFAGLTAAFSMLFFLGMMLL